MNYCIFKAILNVTSDTGLEQFIDEILDTNNQNYSVTVFSTPNFFEIEGLLIASSDNSLKAGLEFEQMTHNSQKRFMDALKGNSNVSALFATDLLPLFDEHIGFASTFQKIANSYQNIQFNKIPDLLLKELDAITDS